MRVRFLIALAVLLNLSGCAVSDGESARRAWLHNTLVDDNRDIVLREPVLSAQKFQKMRFTVYNFYRGTAAQYWRDMSSPSSGRPTTRFVTPASSRIALVGDPHPENIGSYRPFDESITVDFNDFDGSRFGPYHYDVWRLALGFDIAARTIGEAIDTNQRREWVAAAAGAYFDQMDSGEDFRIARNEGFGAIIDDLIRRADRDGRDQEELDEYTVVEDGRRAMFYGEVEPPPSPAFVGDDVREVSPRDRALVERVLRAYPSSLLRPQDRGFFEIKGVSRRVGAGVASYPLMRFYVLVEGESSSIEDDRLLEVKEIRDAPAVGPFLNVLPPRQFSNNAERGVVLQRLLQTTEENDPLLGWAAFDGLSFRVRERTKYQKGFGVDRLAEKLAEGEWSHRDVLGFAVVSGRLLARIHAGGETVDGEPSGPAIRSALATASRPAFVNEVERFVDYYGPIVARDAELFADILDEEGPLLGTPGATR